MSAAVGAGKLSPLAKRLGMNPGMRALIVAAPAGYLEGIEPLPEQISVASVASGEHEFMQLFVTRMEDLRSQLPMLLQFATPDAMVWVAYPKKSSGVASDLSRDTLSAEVVKMGWITVSIVAIDIVWSALRFKPAGQVATKRVWPRS